MLRDFPLACKKQSESSSLADVLKNESFPEFKGYAKIFFYFICVSGSEMCMQFH